MEIRKVNLKEKFKEFHDYWNPRIAGELNNQQIKLVKAKGTFDWHSHVNEDELFFVVKGNFEMQLRDKNLIINEGEFVIIPKGVEHRPVAENEVELMLFEPKTTINTGDNAESKFTKTNLDSL